MNSFEGLNRDFRDCDLCEGCQKREILSGNTRFLIICDQDTQEVYEKLLRFTEVLNLHPLHKALRDGPHVRLEGTSLGFPGEGSLKAAKNCEALTNRLVRAIKPWVTVVVGAKAAKKWSLTNAGMAKTSAGSVLKIRNSPVFVLSNIMAFELDGKRDTVDFIRDTVGQELEALQTYASRVFRRKLN